MAKSKKNSPKASKESQAVTPSNWPTIWRQALPFGIILLAFFIILGRFNFGGWLPINLYELLAQATGWLSWVVLPSLAVYLSVLKFRNLDKKISKWRFLGAFFFIAILATTFHLFVDSEKAQELAQAGSHGGYIGYGLSSLLLMPLNQFTSFLFLFVLGLIAFLAILDITLSRLFEFCQNLWRARFQSEEVSQKEIPSKPKKEFQLSSGVPLENNSSKGRTIPKIPKKEALVVNVDPHWRLPPLTLLNQAKDKADAGDIQANADIIRDTLANFNIDVEMQGANVGPRVTQYTLKPPSGIKLTKILSLDSNIALDLAASSIRIEAPIPGQRAVGVEVPNKKAAIVRISSLLESSQWREAKPQTLAFCIGQDIAGESVIAYLDRMPHLLIAGQTGSGKSVAINVLLTSLLYRNSPSDLKLVLVDPKQVELGLYNHIPHLLTPVITTPEKCISALKWTVAEMERRLKTFAKVSKRNIAEYNALKNEEHMPFIVVVIDELADLMMLASRDVEALIVRIAQKARVAGIHLVLATQRPSVDVITGLIKANVPGRLAFTVASQIDSRIILDQVGAEKLLGLGDILYINSSLPKPKRLQGAFVTDVETEKICDFLRKQRDVQYDSEVVSQEVTLSGYRGQIFSENTDNMDDELYSQAIEVVVKSGKASTSLLQRHLRIGYARAARLIESLEEQGVIGPADGSRPRPVLRTGLPEDEIESSQNTEFDSSV